MSIDRRTFLQSTAALTILSAAGGATVSEAPQPMPKVSSGLPNWIFCTPWANNVEVPWRI